MTNLDTLTRFDGTDEIEILINEDTGESFTSIRGYARMSGVPKSTVSDRLKGVRSNPPVNLEFLSWPELEGVREMCADTTAIVQTAGGPQEVSIICEDLIVAWLPKDNPSAASLLLKMGVRMALHSMAGYKHGQTAKQAKIPNASKHAQYVIKARNKALPALVEAEMALRSAECRFAAGLVSNLYDELSADRDRAPDHCLPQVLQLANLCKKMHKEQRGGMLKDSEKRLIALMLDINPSIGPSVDAYRHQCEVEKIAQIEAAEAAERAAIEAAEADRLESIRLERLAIGSPLDWIMDENAIDEAIQCPIGSVVGLQACYNQYHLWCVSKTVFPLQRKDFKKQLLIMGLKMQVEKGTRATRFTFPADRALILANLKAIAAA
jgi:hypothetical protein